MNTEEIVEKQSNMLLRLSPPIEAFGIGGSFGRRSQDTMSDVDFFILYPSANFFKYLSDFPSTISHTSPIVCQSGPTFNEGFGFTFSYVLANNVWLEYHLNCRETLDVNPMRLDTKIVHDRTGFYTRFKETISSNHKMLLDRLVARAACDHLTRLLKIRKSVYHGELCLILYHINKFRRILIALDRHRLLGKAYSPAFAERQLIKELGHEYSLGLKSTIAKLDYESFLGAFTMIRERVLSSLRDLGRHPCLSTSFYQLEQKLYEEIVGELKKCIS